MTTFSQVRIRDSIATQLLKVVFSIYFLVAITVTVTHMVAEYWHTRKNHRAEMGMFQQVFEQGLAEALWTLDNSQLESLLTGIVEIPGILGVQIIDDRGTQLGAVGWMLDEFNNSLWVNADDQVLKHEPTEIPSGLFGDSFELSHQYKGKAVKVGTVIFYTSEEVVFGKVQYGFLFIILNSIIKTAALWVIFLLFSRIMLNRPLSILTNTAGQLDLDKLQDLQVDVRTQGQNEFKVLEFAFNSMIEKLILSREKLDEINHNLEDQVRQRTQELERSLRELEQQNTTLAASNRKLEDLNSTKEQLLEKLSSLQHNHVRVLQKIIDDFHPTAEASPTKDVMESVRQASRELHIIQETLQPINDLYDSEKLIQNKRVLLAETNRKQQIVAKMALGGTGMELDIVSDLEDGRHLLDSQPYDIVCVNSDMIDLAIHAKETHPEIQSVFMTSKKLSDYLPIVMEYPFLSNIVSRNESDRTFTLKNILTTVSKLIRRDLFGLGKYLNWGTEIQRFPITSSETREDLIQDMETDWRQLGIRRHLITKVSTVVEELLMNAIYDAPTDANGKALYNHLPRTQVIHLPSAEQGVLSYACDGVLLGVSVEDPFGRLDRETIMRYLKSCYTGKAGSLNKEKGGAGRGLFQIIETSDLVVINVKPNIKTEVITLFNVDPRFAQDSKTTSFHYFCS